MTKPISDEPDEADRSELGERAAKALQLEKQQAQAAIAGRKLQADLRKAREAQRKK